MMKDDIRQMNVASSIGRRPMTAAEFEYETARVLGQQQANGLFSPPSPVGVHQPEILAARDVLEKAIVEIESLVSTLAVRLSAVRLARPEPANEKEPKCDPPRCPMACDLYALSGHVGRIASALRQLESEIQL